MKAASTSAGRRLLLGFEGAEVTAAVRDLLRETGAGGVVLFARNAPSAGAVRKLVAALREAAGRPLLVAVDQEGGDVARITEGVTVFPGNLALGAAGDASLARALGTLTGRQLAALGIDLNLAPVVDLPGGAGGPLGTRCFGSDAASALPLARALVEGHRQSGVGCCAKHFPGLGAGCVDPHLSLPVVDLPREQYLEAHTGIFRELVREGGLDAVMTTHMVARGLDPELPATCSPAVVRETLRRGLGFAGLVLTDDLEMGALNRRWPVPEAAVRAAAAGHDLVLVCHDAALQGEAVRALRRALEEGDLDAAEHEQALVRLEGAVRGGPRGSLPEAEESDAVARAIARAALHLFGDPAGLLPLPAEQPLLAVLPHGGPAAAVEASGASRQRQAGGEGLLAGLLAAAFPSARALHVPLDPSEGEVASVLQEAPRFPRLLVAAQRAAAFPGQRRLVEALGRGTADRSVFALLGDGADRALLPERATVLATLGRTPAQLAALVEALRGALLPRGRLPPAWNNP